MGYDIETMQAVQDAREEYHNDLTEEQNERIEEISQEIKENGFYFNAENIKDIMFFHDLEPEQIRDDILGTVKEILNEKQVEKMSEQ